MSCFKEVISYPTNDTGVAKSLHLKRWRRPMYVLVVREDGTVFSYTFGRNRDHSQKFTNFLRAHLWPTYIT